ncbi:hypothetical protein KIPB_002217 [Kipferlia bialata]|uniref:Uncharacterized protein n=1 Tax=Kipferlia bialata TaxID=797122 RepID=A0A9K3GGH4_9EUKA|nr:hypothetical protein KIPB_002217 [Kipferlia bialata]|eukprot:g2217.t1
MDMPSGSDYQHYKHDRESRGHNEGGYRRNGRNQDSRHRGNDRSGGRRDHRDHRHGDSDHQPKYNRRR